MKTLTEMINENRADMRDFTTMMPNTYGTGTTVWSVVWDKENGAVDISYE